MSLSADLGKIIILQIVFISNDRELIVMDRELKVIGKFLDDMQVYASLKLQIYA